MTDLNRARRRLLIAALVLAVINIAAIALLMSPWLHYSSDEYDQLFSELRMKRVQVQPLRDIDKKLAQAGKDIDAFYRNRLPANYSAITAELGDLASEHDVRVAQLKFDDAQLDIPELRRVGVDASLSGEYADVVRFINAVERSKIFFILESVNLTEPQEGELKLQVKLETFLRSGGR